MSDSLLGDCRVCRILVESAAGAVSVGRGSSCCRPLEVPGTSWGSASVQTHNGDNSWI
jgi:hypothetical protein